jgi:hypothetical protein
MVMIKDITFTTKRNWITIPANNAWEAVEWAKENCPSYITNDYSVLGGRTGYYETGRDIENCDFFFVDDEQGSKDMVMFSLKWAS